MLRNPPEIRSRVVVLTITINVVNNIEDARTRVVHPGMANNNVNVLHIPRFVIGDCKVSVLVGPSKYYELVLLRVVIDSTAS